MSKIDEKDLISIDIDEVEVPSDEEYFISGYAVTHVKPYSAERIEGIDLPLYTKREGSDTYYCAGFYCVKYDTGWKYGNSLMLSTLMHYEYRGPFHTKEKTLKVLRDVKRSERC